MWREENRRTRRKPSEQGENNNKLNPHVTLGPGIEPGPHWWEANALITAPTLLSRASSREMAKPLFKTFMSSKKDKFVQILRFLFARYFGKLHSDTLNEFLYFLHERNLKRRLGVIHWQTENRHCVPVASCPRYRFKIPRAFLKSSGLELNNEEKKQIYSFHKVYRNCLSHSQVTGN